jgi:hypothetical protein
MYGSPRCVLLDAQIFVGPRHVLTGRFHYLSTPYRKRLQRARHPRQGLLHLRQHRVRMYVLSRPSCSRASTAPPGLPGHLLTPPVLQSNGALRGRKQGRRGLSTSPRLSNCSVPFTRTPPLRRLSDSSHPRPTSTPLTIRQSRCSSPNTFATVEVPTRTLTSRTVFWLPPPSTFR